MDKAGGSREVVETLSTVEVKKLAECEEAIRENSKMYFLAGDALTQINDERLYKAEFTSFDKYCEGRWGFSGSHARRLMEAYELVKKLQSAIPKIGDEELPQNEFQARLYRDLHEEKHWVRCWRTLLKVAKERSVPISTALIEECAGEPKAGRSKKPSTKAKARHSRDEPADDEHVREALNMISNAKRQVDDFGPKDWEKFLADLESILENA